MKSPLSFFRWPRHRQADSDPIAVLIKSIERDPRQELAYIDLLDAYERQGDLAGAVAYLTTLVTRKPKLDSPYRYLLAAYNRNGDLDGLSRLAARNRNNETAHQWFLMDAYTKNDWNAAIAILSTLVGLYPSDDRWANYLAVAYENKGDPDAAISGLAKLLEVCPDSPSLRLHLEAWLRKVAQVGERAPPAPAKSEPQLDRSSCGSGLGARNTEFENNLKLKTKLQEIETRDRERQKADFQLRARSRPLTAREKFNRIRSTGSRDGFG